MCFATSSITEPALLPASGWAAAVLRGPGDHEVIKTCPGGVADLLAMPRKTTSGRSYTRVQVVEGAQVKSTWF